MGGVLAVVSLVVDATMLVFGVRYQQGMTLASALGLVETAVLAALTVVAVRKSRLWVAIAAALAIPLWLLRFGLPQWSAESVGGYSGWGMLAVLAVGVGLYLRAVDERRVQAVAAAERAQRMELAADLHDFVVHDIHEMLLTAQAGQIIAGDPDRAGDALRRIERSAQRALDTVDHTVHLLRSASDLASLVDRFTATGSVRASLETVDGLPPEVSAMVYRVVVEALTNVRRHASGAGEVSIAVARLAGDTVQVEVVDDGPGGAGHPRGTGGSGLVGLSARIEALGGTLTAGPAQPAGWRVAAILPAGR